MRSLRIPVLKGGEYVKNLYKKDEEHIEEPYGRFFDAVFVACDTYCEDENLRDEDDFDDNQFALRIAELRKGMKTVL